MFAKLFISTKRQSKVERAPQFAAARGMLLILVFAVGVASTAAAIATIDKLSLAVDIDMLLKVIGAVVAMAIAITPILLAPAWATADQGAKAAGLFLIFPLVLLDAASQTNTIMLIERSIREASATGSYIGEPAIWWQLVLVAMIGFQISTFFLRAWLTHVTVTKDEELLDKRRKARAPKQPKLKAVS